jgi:serine protease Do
MKTSPRRALALLLSAALVGGLVSPEAWAQVAPGRISLGGESGMAGAGAAGVNGSLTLSPLAASPLLTPGAGLTASPIFSAPAAAVTPAAFAAASPVSPAVIAPARASALAAADGPVKPGSNTPRGDAPGATRSWLSRAAGIFSRRAAPEAAAAPQTADEAKARADHDFDGSAEAASAEIAAPKGVFGRATAGLKRFAVRRVESYKAKRAVDHDGFGGPKTEPLTTLGSVGHGVKWGLNLVGISAILDFTFTPLINHIAWPLFLSAESLGHFGRAELLTQFGPAQIGMALAQTPLHFLGWTLPISTGMEEFTYRFLGFGLAFAGLALVKPAAGLVSKALAQIPDASGFRSKAQSFLMNAGGLVSYYAFPIAALRSSFNFAVAHFPHWGVDPSLFVMNMIAGYILARAAYKTRGLTAPFVAHLVFNFAMLGSAILGVTFGWPAAATAYTALAAVVGVGALWYNWRSARKERAFNLKGAAAKAMLVVALTAGAFNISGVVGGHDASTMSLASFGAAQVKAPVEKAVKGAPLQAGDAVAPVAAPAAPAADTAQAETQQDMIARVKPSVVKIIVREEMGIAMGSGVIVTPNGRIVTNAHVVGTHRVGDLVVVQLINGTKIQAKILAVNHDRDQAYLQLPRLMDKETHAPVAWPYSNFAGTAPREGDPVFAMGHPLGLPFTVTKGIVSGLGSRGNMYIQFLQTDASITHGNSGGPLYNAQGEVLGINTMGPENSGSIGFSIIAPSIVRALIQYDKVGNINTAALGIITDLSSPDQPEKGVAVEYVRPGSAAAKAGIRRGDVLIGVGGKLLDVDGGKDAAHDLSAALAQAKPGDELVVDVQRGDETLHLKVKLDAKKTSEETSGAHGFDGENQP